MSHATLMRGVCNYFFKCSLTDTETLMTAHLKAGTKCSAAQKVLSLLSQLAWDSHLWWPLLYILQTLFLQSANAWGPVQLCWGVTVERIGSPTTFNLKHLVWLFFSQQSVPQAWALVVWWLTLLSRVSWYWDSVFCLTTDFLCPSESHLSYHSLHSTAKKMLFFLSRGVMRTVLLPLRGEGMVPWRFDRRKNGIFLTHWESWNIYCDTVSCEKQRSILSAHRGDEIIIEFICMWIFDFILAFQCKIF